MIIKDWKEILIKDWEVIDKYDKVSSPKYFDDWKIFAFIAKKDWRNFIVKNWKEFLVKNNNYRNVDEMFRFMYFKNWDKLVYISNPKISIDKILSETHKYTQVFWLTYSHSWDSFAFIVIKKDWKKIVVKNWIESEKYDKISSLKFSSDWKSLVFKAERGKENFIVLNWKKVNKYNSVGWVTFVPNSNSIIYMAFTAYDPKIIPKRIIVNNWIEIDNDNYWDEKTPVYSPDGKSFSFTATKILKDEKSWKKIIIRDWVEINQYDSAKWPMYSPDWKSFSYYAEKDWKKFVVRNWIKSEKYDNVYAAQYSPDWKRFAFQAVKKWKNIIVEQICE